MNDYYRRLIEFMPAGLIESLANLSQELDNAERRLGFARDCFLDTTGPKIDGAADFFEFAGDALTRAAIHARHIGKRLRLQHPPKGT